MEADPPNSPTPSQPHSSPRLRRWRLTITLRVMMILVLVAALSAAWQVNRAKAVQRAIATIGFMHNNVVLDSPLDESGKWNSKFHPPRWLYDSIGKEYFSEIKSVHVNAAFVHALDPEVIQAIATLPGSFRLELEEIVIGTDLQKIGALQNIKEISIGRYACVSCAWAEGTGKDRRWSRELNQEALFTENLWHLSKLKRLQSVEFGRSIPVDAPTLNALATLPDLRSMRIDMWVRLHDAELSALAKFNRIEELHLGCSVGWADGQLLRSRSQPIKSGPLPIQSWNGLRSLSLRFMLLSREELVAITRLPNLETLRLDEVCIVTTGADCRQMCDIELLLLREMSGLKKLKLNPNDFASQAIDTLQLALPNLVIESL